MPKVTKSARNVNTSIVDKLINRFPQFFELNDNGPYTKYSLIPETQENNSNSQVILTKHFSKLLPKITFKGREYRVHPQIYLTDAPFNGFIDYLEVDKIAQENSTVFFMLDGGKYTHFRLLFYFYKNGAKQIEIFDPVSRPGNLSGRGRKEVGYLNYPRKCPAKEKWITGDQTSSLKDRRCWYLCASYLADFKI